MKIKFSPGKMRRAVTLAALAASMPILVATSAHATTAAVPLGCTVTAATPTQIADDFWTGSNRAKAIVTVKCPAGRAVIINDQSMYEVPGGSINRLGKTTHTFLFPTAGTQSGSLTVNVKNTPGTEKVFQQVKGSVHTLDNLPGGAFTVTSGSVLIS